FYQCRHPLQQEGRLPGRPEASLTCCRSYLVSEIRMLRSTLTRARMDRIRLFFASRFCWATASSCRSCRRSTLLTLPSRARIFCSWVITACFTSSISRMITASALLSAVVAPVAVRQAGASSRYIVLPGAARVPPGGYPPELPLPVPAAMHRECVRADTQQRFGHPGTAPLPHSRGSSGRCQCL